MKMYTVQDGLVYKPVNTLSEAVNKAIEWSSRTSKVITVMRGEKTYSWYYRGAELNGKQVDEVWKMQEVM